MVAGAGPRNFTRLKFTDDFILTGKEMAVLLYRTLCSVALYCQRCGQIHIHDVPYFAGQQDIGLQCRNCSHTQATVNLTKQRGLVLKTSCAACHSQNYITFPLSMIKRMKFEKIYCNHDNFELGYIGAWQNVAEFLDFNTAEFEALYPTDEYNFMPRQQILLEALNRVHDLAAGYGITCPCGSHDFIAEVADGSILLECTHCGGQAVIQANSAEDLGRLVSPFKPEFMMPELVKNL